MRTLPLIGFGPQLGSSIRSVVSECSIEVPEILHLRDASRAVDHLSIELPELVLMQFPDPALDAFGLLEVMMSDPWLIHAGIIALCDDEDAAERLEELRVANLIVTIDRRRLRHHLPRVLDLIHDNRRILFQREIAPDLAREISGRFLLGNDVVEARCLSNLVCNFLYNSNRVDSEAKYRLNLALHEMLVNAIEHGNCGIGSEERTRWLETHGSLAGLIEQRCRDPRIGARRVTCEYSIGRDRSRFRIADEGNGFDWRDLADPTDPRHRLRSHGRGILISRSVVENLRFNDRGNEVRFEVPHADDEASMTPAPFAAFAPRDVAPDELVFEQGEQGSFVYYIVKGRYDVSLDGRLIATLTPDDVFVGEMSFLLNNVRSATVRARTAGRLIRITRKDFIEAVKSHPHYALLLARLLARRIERSNRLRTEALAGSAERADEAPKRRMQGSRS